MKSYGMTRIYIGFFFFKKQLHGNKRLHDQYTQPAAFPLLCLSCVLQESRAKVILSHHHILLSGALHSPYPFPAFKMHLQATNTPVKTFNHC